MKQNFLKIFSKYRTAIDEELKFFFDAEIKAAKTSFLIKTLKKLKEFSLRPGKRIRAVLINYGYFLAGGKDKKSILKTSIFIELIHNFLLIHDDIIDEEEMRRGKKTMHRLYQESSKFKKDQFHYGSSMAIGAGDLMEFIGRKILDKAKISADKKNKAIEKLNHILELTAYGEIFEFWLRDGFKNGDKIKEKDILDVYKTKTAFYTFVGPLQIGAILAGGDQRLLNHLEKIGLSLGVAFQLEDDMQDLFLEEASDIKEGQPNFLVLKMINGKWPAIKKYLNRKKISKTEINFIKNNALRCGASIDCQEMAKDLISQAKKDIISFGYPKKDQSFLLDLADYILERKN